MALITLEVTKFQCIKMLKNVKAIECRRQYKTILLYKRFNKSANQRLVFTYLMSDLNIENKPYLHENKGKEN